jgi:Fe2+ or Zn2+ uptake regulation protein
MGHPLLDRLHFYLAQINRSRGPARDKVFLAIHQSDNGSKAEIYKSLTRLNGSPFDRKSFNRALDFLREVGAVHEAPGNRYEIAQPLAATPHRHFLACTKCGRRFAFVSPQLETQIIRTAASHQFELESHQLELSGRCYLCKE